MTKAMKIWLITAASLVLIGSGLFAGVMTVLKWDFTQLSTTKYETNVHEVGNDYQNITIVSDTADIVFVPSKDGRSTVTCREQANARHKVSSKDGALVIEITDNRAWYDHIRFGFDKKPQITVSISGGIYSALSVKSDTGHVEIPSDFAFRSMNVEVETGHVKSRARTLDFTNIKTTTGDIDVADVTVGSLSLSVTTGKISVSRVACQGNMTVDVTTGKTYLTDVTCKSLTSNGSTGDIELQNTIASDWYIKRTTGDVTFDDCDAWNITVQTSTGDVKGNLLTNKVFLTKCSTGRVDVPQTSTGGKCDISTSTGDIIITVG